ncbi:hypothetical protein L0663_01000 [Dyadobacter sp. CY107]|nr:hypothetical protein [Dyadobacter fanqingshengii]MCF2501940.1 hypothetical protein [Dyadobacter fanqingshengii]
MSATSKTSGNTANSQNNRLKTAPKQGNIIVEKTFRMAETFSKFPLPNK